MGGRPACRLLGGHGARGPAASRRGAARLHGAGVCRRGGPREVESGVDEVQSAFQRLLAWPGWGWRGRGGIRWAWGAEAATCSWGKGLLQVLGVRQEFQEGRGWQTVRDRSGGWHGPRPQFPCLYNEGWARWSPRRILKAREGTVGLEERWVSSEWRGLTQLFRRGEG